MLRKTCDGCHVFWASHVGRGTGIGYQAVAWGCLGSPGRGFSARACGGVVVARSPVHSGQMGDGGGRAGMHSKGGRYPPSPSTAPSLCPATVPLTPSASLNGIRNRQ